MGDITLSELDTRLAQFGKRLQRQQNLLYRRGALTTDHSLEIAQLDEKTRRLQVKLRMKLAAAHGVDWELLKLELQNDLLLLTNSFRNWTRRLDNSFDGSR
jgi:hypothetical protein